MFTGIIKDIGFVKDSIVSGTNKTFWIESSISGNLRIDESLSHNGVCLTVEEVNGNSHRITAIKETLDKTNLNTWKTGEKINLERSLEMNARLDGHIVQGHVDTTARCINKKELNGSTAFTFKYKKKFARLIIEKGSICVNGISLTAFNVTKNTFTVAIIPYTLENTNLSFIVTNSIVNIEFDILGKYVLRALKL